jgi:prolyl-tRNA editing enzyme YbaK/EbsC (Cys-tRNA(Pro) deacylase)
VKSLVFDLVTADGEVRPVIALLAGPTAWTRRSWRRRAGPSAGRVDADRVRAVTGFPIGACPRSATRRRCRPSWTSDLLDHAEVWAAGGTPQVVFGIAPTALVVATDGDVCDLSEKANP